MSALAQETMRTAQQKQKKWYELKARDMVFGPGQQLLLLLPTSNSKLPKWYGPYEDSRRVSKVTYEVHIPERVACFWTERLGSKGVSGNERGH